MIEKYRSKQIQISRKEVLRYLGYGNHEMDEETGILYDECLEKLEKTIDCRACRCRLPVQVSEKGVFFADTFVPSRSLGAHLTGAEEIFLMCATIGPAFDRESDRLMHVSPARALIFQAMGTAAVEEWCDRLGEEWLFDLMPEGLQLTSRYSPGYGDLDIGLQPMLLSLTDAGRSAGIVLTNGGMMVPRKSVSAIIGLVKERTEARADGCETCTLKECIYCRKEQALKGGRE